MGGSWERPSDRMEDASFWGLQLSPRSSETHLLFIIAGQPRPEGVTSTGHVPEGKRRGHLF